MDCLAPGLHRQAADWTLPRLELADLWSRPRTAKQKHNCELCHIPDGGILHIPSLGLDSVKGTGLVCGCPPATGTISVNPLCVCVCLWETVYVV